VRHLQCNEGGILRQDYIEILEHLEGTLNRQNYSMSIYKCSYRNGNTEQVGLAVTLWTCIHEVLGSTPVSWLRFLLFPQSFQANAGTDLDRPLPSKCFPLHRSSTILLFDSTELYSRYREYHEIGHDIELVITGPKVQQQESTEMLCCVIMCTEIASTVMDRRGVLCGGRDTRGLQNPSRNVSLRGRRILPLPDDVQSCGEIMRCLCEKSIIKGGLKTWISDANETVKRLC
jgi:hypothetical protein